MDLAVIAAFTAAGISLVNVAITVRATSGGSLQQWRRTEVRPAVARILALSDQAMREQHHAMCLHRDRFGLGVRGPYEGDQADKLRAEERDHWKNSRDARQKLSFEVAQGYNLAAACLSGIFVLYARETLHVPVAAYGLLTAAAAPAAIAAGLKPELLARRLPGRQVVAVCCLAQAAGWAVLAACPGIWAAVLGMVVLGAANMQASVALSTACQTLTPGTMLGAVSAACLTFVVGGAGLGALAGGLASKLAGLNAAVILAAAIAAVTAIAVGPALEGRRNPHHREPPPGASSPGACTPGR